MVILKKEKHKKQIDSRNPKRTVRNIWIGINVVWTVINIFFSPIAQRFANDFYDYKLSQPVRRILGVQDDQTKNIGCDYQTCDFFKNTKLWNDFGRFDIISEDPQVLKTADSNIGSVAYR